MTKDHRPLTGIALALVLGLAACGSPAAPAENVPVTRVLRGQYSALANAQRLVIRTQTQLDEAWTAAFRTQSHPPPVPSVDFTTELVIVAAMGSRPTSGYCISVDSAAATDGMVTVAVTTTSPPAGSGLLQVITMPFDVVRLPRPADSVSFVEKTQTAQCN